MEYITQYKKHLLVKIEHINYNITDP